MKDDVDPATSFDAAVEGLLADAPESTETTATNVVMGAAPANREAAGQGPEMFLS